MMTAVKTPLAMENIIDHKGHLYFHSYLTNCIFELSPLMEYVSVIKRLPWNTQTSHCSPDYGYIYAFENKIFLVPDMADNVCVYDMQNDVIRYLSIPKCIKNVTNYYNGVKCDKYLFLIPCDTDVVVKIDMEIEAVTVIESNYLLGLRNIAWGAVAQIDNQILFTNLRNNSIYCIDAKDESIKKMEIDYDGGLSGVVVDGDHYWVSPKKFEKLLCLNRNFEIEAEYSVDVEDYESGDWSIHKIIHIGNELFFLPRSSNKLICFDTNKKIYNDIKIRERDFDNISDKYSPVSNLWKTGDKLFCVYSKTGEIVNLDDGMSLPIPVENAIKGAVFHEMTHESKNGFDNLEYFIEFIKEG